MPYCANCGTSVNESTCFCPQCGAPRVLPNSPPPINALSNGFPQTAQQTAAPVAIVSVLPHVHILTLQRELEPYTLVFTPEQTIFARLTAGMLQNARDEAQAQGKASGKGWLGRANDQMRAPEKIHERYFGMTPQQILSETPGNFAVDHRDVASAAVKQAYAPTNMDCPGDPYAAAELDTGSGVLRWRVSLRVKDVVDLLNNFYSGRVSS
jgi:hypothetical protein